ncbi:acyl-CoA-like ligand-binding transcription factor [Rhodococcus artemisiae]|uniref:TetR family transcriptional regulator n=1 Tax=Rhodococcus artemisiae TaxID=714159 RepID=A0ABU7LDY4_9NOCA|nr:TetR family transcriptional regulator [Rhodococcus artemisiae]MEE2059112.1 TetR family transcriptional regulator [Rhodococcus artemisiae]
MIEPGDERTEHGARWGRPAATSAPELAAVAQTLFLQRGFDEVTVDDIAAAAGISRRTFFRYFPTKADVLWVESSAELAQLHDGLESSTGRSEPCRDSLIRAVIAALEFPPEQREWALHRAQLVLDVPAVQTHTTMRMNAWRTEVTDYVARSTGSSCDDLVPLTVGHATVSAVQAAHRYWVTHPDEELAAVLEQTLEITLPATFAANDMKAMPRQDDGFDTASSRADEALSGIAGERATSNE